MSEPNIERIRIFVDMDGVIVDFDAYARAMEQPGDEIKKRAGAYLRMKPIPGAIEAVRSLIGMGYDVWLASKPPTGIAFAYGDKAQWVFDNLPELKRKLILTHDKGLLGCENDILIDDRPHKANCDKFRGKLIRFTNNWPEVIDCIQSEHAPSSPAMSLKYFHPPFELREPQSDNEACNIVDSAGNPVAMMYWPTHPVEETLAAEQETYALGRAFAGRAPSSPAAPTPHKLSFRNWLISGGSGHEDGVDGIRACTLPLTSAIEMVDEYMEYLAEVTPPSPCCANPKMVVNGVCDFGADDTAEDVLSLSHKRENDCVNWRPTHNVCLNCGKEEKI